MDGVDGAVSLVQEIGKLGMLAGVAIKPKTPVQPLLEVMRKCIEQGTPGMVIKNIYLFYIFGIAVKLSVPI